MKATYEEFENLYQALGGALPTFRHDYFHPVRVAFQALENAYSAPRRCYHTLEHVSWVLRRLRDLEEVERGRGAKFDEEGWRLIEWAAWFHDLVNVGAPDDEELSAEEACRLLPLPRRTIHVDETIRRLIRATSHARVPRERDAAILCDADLAILGADDEVFDRYEAQVREEWSHVPDELFAGGRFAILKRIADHPRIYWTEEGRQRWESRARSNLGRSMLRLSRVVDGLEKL